MKEITYHFSLNYNINHSCTVVIETRAIKRAIKSVDGVNASNSLQYLKSETKSYSVNEVDDLIVEKLKTEPSMELSKEITYVKFEKFMDESCDLFSIDLDK